tara:strand:- start:2769 stop:3521 length:753 start_codon:yes stop_codon:yes gene_type:complete
MYSGDTRVACVQCDNRNNLHEDVLFNLNIRANRLQCDKINIKHVFFKFESINPIFDKIKVLYHLMEKMKNEYDVIINLDSKDAFIYDSYKLKQLINILIKSEKYGLFSRDPNNYEVPKSLHINYLHHEKKEQTFINAGSFIIKNNSETRNFIRDVIRYSEVNIGFINKWPYDQYYLSKYVYNNKENFYIFKCDVLNTPYGSILRHNWMKNEQLKNDLIYVIENNEQSQIEISLEELISTAPYINTGVFLL